MRLLIAFLLALGVDHAEAQTTWRMPTEYPASAMPGEGIASFAANVAKRAGNLLTVEPSYDAKLGIKSADLPKAVNEGRAEAGDAFGGALNSLDPVFSLSSLPFVTPSIGDAKRTRGSGPPALRPGLRGARDSASLRHAVATERPVDQGRARVG